MRAYLQETPQYMTYNKSFTKGNKLNNYNLILSLKIIKLCQSGLSQTNTSYHIV